MHENIGVRFRCHTGHAYSLETLLSELSEQNEHTLWAGVRSLQETVALLRHMATTLEGHQHAEHASALRQKAQETEARANKIAR